MMRRDPCRFSPPSGASSSRDADDGESASESDPLYAVRRILALKRVRGRKLEYEIEWEPDPTTEETYDSSFEPEDNLASALVEEFRQQHPQLIEQVVPALQSPGCSRLRQRVSRYMLGAWRQGRLRLASAERWCGAEQASLRRAAQAEVGGGAGVVADVPSCPNRP